MTSHPKPQKISEDCAQDSMANPIISNYITSIPRYTKSKMVSSSREEISPILEEKEDSPSTAGPS